jgi:hypothetical protein
VILNVFRTGFRQLLREPLIEFGCTGDCQSVAFGPRFYTLYELLSVRALCNRWNSIAVMCELHCSEFELGCSESVGKQGNAGSLGNMRS